MAASVAVAGVIDVVDLRIWVVASRADAATAEVAATVAAAAVAAEAFGVFAKESVTASVLVKRSETTSSGRVPPPLVDLATSAAMLVRYDVTAETLGSAVRLLSVKLGAVESTSAIDKGVCGGGGEGGEGGEGGAGGGANGGEGGGAGGGEGAATMALETKGVLVERSVRAVPLVRAAGFASERELVRELAPVDARACVSNWVMETTCTALVVVLLVVAVPAPRG